MVKGLPSTTHRCGSILCSMPLGLEKAFQEMQQQKQESPGLEVALGVFIHTDVC